MNMEFKYRTLVNRHQRQIYSVAMRMLNNRSEAEEITQDAYERLWKHIAELTEEDALPWLIRVTRNLCIDLLRKRRETVELDLDMECKDDSKTPQGAAQHGQLSRWIRDAIDGLKEPYKSLIVMADLEQQSVRDMASKMNLNENQVKVYVHRARKNLRNILQAVEL